MLSLETMYCVEGQQATLLCSNRDCQNSAYICQDEFCKCHSQHQICQKKMYRNILDQIKIKINQTIGPLENLVLWYEEIMKLILIQKTELQCKLDKVYQFIYEEEQSKFLQAIQKRTFINGKQVGAVLDQLNKQKTTLNFSQLLQNQAVKTKMSIQQGLFNLKRIWRKKRKITEQETKIRLRQCEVRYVYINGKWSKPLSISSSFKQIPLEVIEGYDLNEIDQIAIEGIASHCPKLKRLQIGVASSFTKVDDQCCQMIADELKRLEILKIHHSSGITDRGGLALAAKLPILKQLELVDCNLTFEGKQEVKRRQSGCQKIKF